jgi:hypothetical protein
VETKLPVDLVKPWSTSDRPESTKKTSSPREIPCLTNAKELQSAETDNQRKNEDINLAQRRRKFRQLGEKADMAGTIAPANIVFVSHQEFRPSPRLIFVPIYASICVRGIASHWLGQHL